MEKTKLGMILFLASESVFFILLIIAFVFYHREAGNGPDAAGSLDTAKSALFTLFLLSSSFTVWRAVVSSRTERHRATLAWLLATIVLGGVFLLGQAREYAHLIVQNVTISRDLFGTTFFTLTGFHGLHVFIGLVMLGILFGTGWRWKDTDPQPQAVECISLYWHFVDAVWMVIFPVVYLWGAL
jgi:heme/copper-type cytochrome/quinol oxidase subunit 3